MPREVYMRVPVLIFILLFLSAPAFAQQPAAPSAAAVKTVATSADVAAIVAELKARPPAPLVSAPLLQLAPYRVNVEYRTAAASASVHENDAELFYVIDGAGTLVTGGTLTDSSRSNAANLTGKGIANGTTQRVTKGDFVIVPEGTPHQFTAVDGSLTLMSLHLPRKP
jgi:mannose-6-phosphate isomerase-like protein (cupin superfamily)